MRLKFVDPMLTWSALSNIACIIRIMDRRDGFDKKTKNTSGIII